MIHSVKGRLHVNEGDEQVSVLSELLSLLYYEPESREVVGGGAVWHETSLLLVASACGCRMGSGK